MCPSLVGHYTLPPRGDMHEYLAPDSRLPRIRRQTSRCTIS
ncbi:hypothetical protein BSPWISOX_1626 [uncultured Gammaproteobacteria bacterium]|nr:hypothetical protein BSPCLSOX_2132 [uncultured Gammaproteobacteria bacterium]VVH63349.1 hypothetical protein BSPWISOX_1626 [uncultured Gammaproteobacteria bacterium]